MKKLLFSLVIIGSFSFNVKADDNMDPVPATVIWGVASVAGGLVVATGVESYNQLTDDTTTNTMDNTMTFTNTNEGN